MSTQARPSFRSNSNFVASLSDAATGASQTTIGVARASPDTEITANKHGIIFVIKFIAPPVWFVVACFDFHFAQHSIWLQAPKNAGRSGSPHQRSNPRA